jgi:hypothetical protein
MSSANTIYLRQGQSQRVQLERVANAALRPGHLIELMSTNKFRMHATAGGSVSPIMFAIEDTLQGKDVTEAYAATDIVVGVIPQRGDFIRAWLKNGENASIGSKLESAGAGLLQVHTADGSNAPNVEEQVVAIAMEAANLSSSSGADASIGTQDGAGNVAIWVMVI